MTTIRIKPLQRKTRERSTPSAASEEVDVDEASGVEDEPDQPEEPLAEEAEHDEEDQENVEEHEQDSDEEAEPSYRPRGRGRGRGRPRGRGRGGPRSLLHSRLGSPANALSRTVDGVTYPISEDEVQTPNDPIGDTKINSDGELQGERAFKMQTFTIPTRHPNRRYMLAIDCARAAGFRDSLYYFRKNAKAHKLLATQSEKDGLIGRGILAPALRSRAVTFVAAHAAFKLHGAKVLKDGKWVTDDYFEEPAKEACAAAGATPGEVMGDPPEPMYLNADGTLQSFASKSKAHQPDRTLGLYRPGGPTTVFGGIGLGPFSDGPLTATKKANYNRDGINVENWMHVAALRTAERNSSWLKARREQTSYEAHTGLEHFRVDTQPTRARWENLNDPSKRIIGASRVGKNAWGLAWIDTVLELPPDVEDKAPYEIPPDDDEDLGMTIEEVQVAV